jgi:hypothetical protein
LELHGDIAAAQTLVHLKDLDYTYADPESRQEFSSVEAVAEFFGDRIFQLAALPKGKVGT